ncbi:MAG: fused MFS/spermidine synthase, partial [Acidobacteriota bacterium]
MNRQTWKVAALLFGSGTCALIYQTTWLRAFRMIFGASTFATAAVLAIFMGGLGLGSALLGRRADAQERPLRFYGMLELLIAVSAAISPALLWLIGKIYIATGGSVTLGVAGATVVRLVLSMLVLGAPTILMGGTLPAAARAVETSDDRGRRKLSLLYALNTLGAVTGTLVSTFYMLEHFGNRMTLFIAVAVNIVVAVAAILLPEGDAQAVSAEEAQAPAQPRKRKKGADAEALPVRTSGASSAMAVPARVVLAASAIVGFAFLLMELVWYRMLGPLLGGTTFTFGLILATALLGIGLGGVAYSMLGAGSSATAGGFALTCSLEAALIIVPFALGDRLAILANLLRNLGRIGFGGNVLAWTILTVITVLPAAFVSGIQFPMLIALLGRGREEVGRQVGLAYAWNTIGAIAGSLAGGFGLIPLLSAPGCWRLVASLLAITGMVAMTYAVREKQRGAASLSTIAALLAIAATFTTGPTPVWRHAGIGAGRAPQPESVNALRDWMNLQRRTTVWEMDGRESSVALVDNDDYAFIVNGKADGSARGDDGTQVMGGLIGAILHPNPRTSLVIGLGTGSTAGWLGAVPGMQRVDAVELEPAVLRVAQDMAAVNHDVLKNPKVHVHIADAREVLLTTRERYDIIFSEPSNPYRAGIASLFTREFYQAASDRLQTGGIFLQWVQAYDIDARTVKTIYATIGSIFSHVETWQTGEGDLLLLATRDPLTYDIDLVRTRLIQEPYRKAVQATWRVETAEGFLSHFIANESLSGDIAHGGELNTDDKTPIEFGFARNLGDKSVFKMDDLIHLAYLRGAFRPDRISGNVDWALTLMHRAGEPGIDEAPPSADDEYRSRHEFAQAAAKADFVTALKTWREHHWQPINTREQAALASLLAMDGSDEALPLADSLALIQPVERDAVVGALRERQGRRAEAVEALEKAFVAYRTDPWPDGALTGRALDAALRLSYSDKVVAARMADAVS